MYANSTVCIAYCMYALHTAAVVFQAGAVAIQILPGPLANGDYMFLSSSAADVLLYALDASNLQVGVPLVYSVCLLWCVVCLVCKPNQAGNCNPNQASSRRNFMNTRVTSWSCLGVCMEVLVPAVCGLQLCLVAWRGV